MDTTWQGRPDSKTVRAMCASGLFLLTFSADGGHLTDGYRTGRSGPPPAFLFGVMAMETLGHVIYAVIVLVLSLAGIDGLVELWNKPRQRK